MRTLEKPVRPTAILLACSFALAGCHPGIYDARTLPPQFNAPTVTDVLSLDLSAMAAVRQPSDVVNAGDVVNVTVVSGAPKERPATWPLRVNDAGRINVPLIGEISVTGMNMRETERAIQEAGVQRGVYTRPSVSASIESRHVSRITVMGAVEKPGTYSLDSTESDLMTAIMRAGGLSEDADRFVEVRHASTGASYTNDPTRDSPNRLTSYVGETTSSNNSQPEHIDLVEATSLPEFQPPKVSDGTVINVSVKPERSVHVIGLVKRPNRYAMSNKRDLRVLDAVAMAGDTSISIADRVHVIRHVPGYSEPIVVHVSLRRAKRDGSSNIVLAPGDVISVEETPNTFMIGTIRQFVRFGVSSRVLF